jgi:hypothetical protein
MSEVYDDTPTGQQSLQDGARLAYQPGYWLPWEQQHPIDNMSGVVLADQDPIGHAEWKDERSDSNKDQAALAESEK